MKGVDFSTGYTTRGLQPCLLSFREPKAQMPRAMREALAEFNRRAHINLLMSFFSLPQQLARVFLFVVSHA